MADMKPIVIDQTTGGGAPAMTIYQTGKTMPDSGVVIIKGVIREGD